jgi:hypothetical protein
VSPLSKLEHLRPTPVAPLNGFKSSLLKGKMPNESTEVAFLGVEHPTSCKTPRCHLKTPSLRLTGQLCAAFPLVHVDAEGRADEQAAPRGRQLLVVGLAPTLRRLQKSVQTVRIYVGLSPCPSATPQRQLPFPAVHAVGEAPLSLDGVDNQKRARSPRLVHNAVVSGDRSLPDDALDSVAGVPETDCSDARDLRELSLNHSLLRGLRNGDFRLEERSDGCQPFLGAQPQRLPEDAGLTAEDSVFISCNIQVVETGVAQKVVQDGLRGFRLGVAQDVAGKEDGTLRGGYPGHSGSGDQMLHHPRVGRHLSIPAVG